MHESSKQTVPHLVAEDLSFAQHLRHVRDVGDRLEHKGILKVSLRFPDDHSQYLGNLVVSLHKHHGHGLPITHSASRGWFWDLRPNSSSFQSANHQARSETMQDFPWHTDCSYELSPSARDALFQPEFRINIPPEFIKHPDHRHTVGSLLARQNQATMVRFREEIVTPLSDLAARALDELKRLLQSRYRSTLHLTPANLPQNSIILLDNHRWLHARNVVKDPTRHLRRVRWNAVPFASSSGNR